MGLIPSIISSVSNFIGAGQARDYETGAAQTQMDFQRRMSSTAHTREVNDLKNAGLNPILSAGGQGASSPSGAAGTAPAPPQIDMEPIYQAANLKMAEERLNVDKANSAASIAKGLTDQELTKVKTILGKKGIFRATMEDRAFKFLDKQTKELPKKIKFNEHLLPGMMDKNPGLIKNPASDTLGLP